MKRFVSTFRTVSKDLPTITMLSWLLAGWPLILLIYLSDPPRNYSGSDEHYYYGFIIFLICIGILFTPYFVWASIRRIKNLKRVLSSGPEVKGRVSSIEFNRDRKTHRKSSVRIECEYGKGNRNFMRFCVTPVAYRRLIRQSLDDIVW